MERSATATRHIGQRTFASRIAGPMEVLSDTDTHDPT